MRVSDLKREVLSASIGLERVGSVRPVTHTEQQPRLCGPPLVRHVQQVRGQLVGCDDRAIGVWNRHLVAVTRRIPSGHC